MRLRLLTENATSVLVAIQVALAAWSAPIAQGSDRERIQVETILVPESDVAAAFPPGSDLVAMPEADFEALVRAAERELGATADARPPKIIRARHDVRWGAGLLRGRSSLSVVGASGRAKDLLLGPWTPAISAASVLDPTSGPRTGPDGRFLWRIAAGDTGGPRIEWELAASPGSEGRWFTVGLPQCEATELSLELPAEFTPEGPPGIRRGPLPGSNEHLRRWTFHGATGPEPFRLEMKDVGDTDVPQIWVSGNTRVKVGDSSAEWRADWTVLHEGDEAGVLQVELDDSLRLIEAGGSGVSGFEESALAEGGRLVTLRLNDEGSGESSVFLRGVVPVPDEGPWLVPTTRLVGAEWTGGRTVVQIASTRTLESSRLLAGTSVVPTQAELDGAPGQDLVLAFSTDTMGSSAELTFRAPRLDAVLEISGQAHLGRESSRFEARLVWNIYRGRALNLRVELPALWDVDQLTLADASRTPVPWQVETRDDGVAELVIIVPPALEITQPDALAMILSAKAHGVERGGPRRLPHLKVADSRLADERWLASTDPRTTLRPLRAEGLAWLEPELEGVAISPEVGTPLVWRWISLDGEADFDLEPTGFPLTADVVEHAWIDSERVAIDIQLKMEPGPQPIDSLAVLLVGDFPVEPTWRILSVDQSQPLVARSLALEEQADAGLPRLSGIAQQLELPAPQREGFTLLARLEGEWDGSGALPVLLLSEVHRLRVRVQVSVEETSRSTARVENAVRLNPVWVPFDDPRATDSSTQGTRSPTYRLAHDIGYGSASGVPRILVQTEALEPVGPAGVIRDAVLATMLTPGETTMHRLTLRLVSAGVRTLDLIMPERATLQRVRVDGRDNLPSLQGETIAIPIPSASAARPVCVLELDYEVEFTESIPLVTRVTPPCPLLSLPCLNFTWELTSATQMSRSLAKSSNLSVTEPTPEASLARHLVGDWPTLGQWHAETIPSVARFADLAALVPLNDPDGISLWELLLRWDSADRPVLVDRTALAAAGWGPRSRILNPTSRPAASSGVGRWFRSLGLELVPVDSSLLVTTREQALSLTTNDRASFELDREVARAIWYGNGFSDRFQSVARWRDEETSEPLEGLDGPRSVFGRDVAWYEQVGWPDAQDDAIVTWPKDATRLWSWSLALGIFAIGARTRRASPRRRLWGVLALAATAACSAGSGDFLGSAIGSGILYGAIGSIAFWLGQSIRAESTRSRHAAGAWSRRTPVGSGVRTETLILLVATLTHLAVEVRGGAYDEEIGSRRVPDSILAVVPHDGTGRGLGLVWIRREDAELLRDLANPNRPVDAGPSTIDAVHELRFLGDEIELVSRVEVSLDGPGPLPWSLSVGALPIESVELDGLKTAATVNASGDVAQVWIQGEGRHQVRIRRLFPNPRATGQRQIIVAIPPVLTAQARWLASQDPLPLTLKSTRGGSSTHPDGTTVVALGPTPRIEIRDQIQGDLPGAASRADVEGTLLWDAEPSGDRVRARLAYGNLDEVPEIRVHLGAGLRVQSASMMGLVQWRLEVASGGAVWVGQLDPPSSGANTLTLDLWRPAPTSEPDQGAAMSRSRTLPKVDPEGVASYVGTLGFRRPSYWVGRLGAASIRGAEAVLDESFVQSWGQLPESMSTLAGAIRFASTPDARLRTGPVEPRTSVRPTVQLTVQPGRLLVHATAELLPDSPPPHEYQVRIPEEMTIVRVVADGLTDWSRPAPDLLRLRFDRDFGGARAKMVRIEGWIGVATSPMSDSANSHDLAIPWPEWLGADQQEGRLLVSADGVNAVEIDQGASLSTLPPERRDAEPSQPRRSTGPPPKAYRVTQPHDLGRIRWMETGPMARVIAHSLLTIHPESTTLATTLRYDVAGGPLRTLVVRVPNEWADTARIRAFGHDGNFERRVNGGSTEFSIDLSQPLWGTQFVQIDSVRPFDPRDGLAFPNIVPLMPKEQQNSFQSYLMIADASGESLAPGGSSEVQPIDPGRFSDDLFSPLESARLYAYSVLRDGWRVSVPGVSTARPALEGGIGALVSTADVICVVRADGTTFGRAAYELDPRPGAFLSLKLAGDGRLLAATVGTRPVRPLRSRAGEWLIPIGSRDARRVVVAWAAKEPEIQAAGGAPIIYPELTGSTPLTLVTLIGPPGVIEATGGLEVTGASIERERLAAISRRIADSIDPGRFDRGSPRDRAELLASLIRFQVQLRTAERASEMELAAGAGTGSDPATVPLEMIPALRDSLRETLEAVGLDEFLRSSEVRVGTASLPDPLADVPELIEPRSLLNLRRIGEPRYFRVAEGSPNRVAIAIEARPSNPSTTPNQRRSILLAILGLGSAGLALTGVVRHGGRVAAVIGASVLVTLVGVAAPFGSVLILGLIATGWLVADPGPPVARRETSSEAA